MACKRLFKIINFQYHPFYLANDFVYSTNCIWRIHVFLEDNFFLSIYIIERYITWTCVTFGWSFFPSSILGLSNICLSFFIASFQPLMDHHLSVVIIITLALKISLILLSKHWIIDMHTTLQVITYICFAWNWVCVCVVCTLSSV
jgi:hypothetical protein